MELSSKEIRKTIEENWKEYQVIGGLNGGSDRISKKNPVVKFVERA